MTDIFKIERSYSVIFSDVRVNTSTTEESLQKWCKSVNYTDNIAKSGRVWIRGFRDKRVLASGIQNKRQNTVRNFI